MRKIKILGITIFTVLAFGAISVASASAGPLWLEGGASIGKQELAETVGKWTLLGKGIFGIGELEVECNEKLIGWVGPGSEDSVTEATDLTGKKVINCTTIKESVAKCFTSLVLFEAEHLPWKTELLESAGSVTDDFKSSGFGVPAFKVSCELSTGKFTEELCEGIVKTDKLVNLGTGEVESKELKVATEKCKGAGNTAEVSAGGKIKLALSTEPLTAHVVAAAGPSWLMGGASIGKQELAETVGKWTLLGKGIFGIGELEVECNEKLIGWVGPGSEDSVTEATDLTGKKVINCTTIKESVAKCFTSLVLFEAEHLPWKTELLESAGSVTDDFKSSGFGVPAFKVSCELSTGKFTEELCEGIVKTDKLVNLGTGEVESKELKVATEKCKGAGNTAEVSAGGKIKLALSTEPLTAHNSP